MSEFLWAIIALGAWCWGYCAGMAWAAAFRPTVIQVRTVIERKGCALDD